MTDHWKDVERAQCDLDDYACGWQEPAMRMAVDALNFAVDAARANDAAERAARDAAYEARVQRDHDEIVELTTEIARLRARVDEDVHLRAVVELYRSNPMEMAAALVRLRDAVSALRAGADVGQEGAA